MRPGIARYTVLYDGSCRFCVESVRGLRRLVPRGTVAFVDFNTPGAIGAIPGVTSGHCRSGVQVVTPEGRVFGGAEGVARLLATRPVLAPLAALYFIPGLRWLWDRVYAVIARNRYRILGVVRPGGCVGGACGIHGPAPAGDLPPVPGSPIVQAEPAADSRAMH